MSRRHTSRRARSGGEVSLSTRKTSASGWNNKKGPSKKKFDGTPSAPEFGGKNMQGGRPSRPGGGDAAVRKFAGKPGDGGKKSPAPRKSWKKDEEQRPAVARPILKTAQPVLKKKPQKPDEEPPKRPQRKWNDAPTAGPSTTKLFRKDERKSPTGEPPKPRGIGFRSGPPPEGAMPPVRGTAPVTGQGKRPLKTLERVLSKAGVCSRTEARSHIGAGRVEVNGRVIRTPDFWVDLGRDKVSLEGEPVRLKDRSDLYIVLNKPKGYITTYKDPDGRPTVYELVKDLGEWVVPVGRLDQDTTGLLLMTNDTQFAERMTNPDHRVPKTYLVKASTMLTDEQLDLLRNGLELNDGPTRPAKVTRLRDSGKYTHFEITVTEGRNRQVRRMVEAIGSKVLKLVRVQIGGLKLEGLEIGKWQRLSKAEVDSLG